MKKIEPPTIYNIELLQTRKDTIENFLKLAVIGMFESKYYDMNDGETVFKAFVIDLKNSIDCPTPLANFCAGLLQGLKEVDKQKHAHKAARNIERGN